MNLLSIAMIADNFKTKNEKINMRIQKIRDRLKMNDIKISSEYTKIGPMKYYYDCIPLVTKNKDVLKKPDMICKIYVNWNNEPFNPKVSSISNLTPQWGWSVDIVDAEHTRNKYKNKNSFWVVFDTYERAEEYKKLFNSMFLTAIEQDCIEEYKRFKENPEKRPLTFDKLVNNAYELYDAVDKNEI